MSVSIARERPDTPEAMALIGELDAYLDLLYPSESQHGFSVDQLLAEDVAFFILRYNDALVGCGGVKLFEDDYAEIKRMYVRPQHRGMGFAKVMLEHLSDYARRQGISRLRLETGIYQTEAIGLYERLGFQPIGPFGAYSADPLSLFYEKRIA